MVSKTDRDILRSLAGRIAEIAALPVHEKTRAEWRRTNALKVGKPMISIIQQPWNELWAVDDELELQTTDQFCRDIEWGLRCTLYQWDHMRGDMVIDPVYYTPLVIHDSGFGITSDAQTIQQGDKGGIYAYGYHQQINEEKDVEKIKDPVLSLDMEATDQNVEKLSYIFGDILPVKPIGVLHYWFAPWDALVQWWEVQQVLMDIVVRPELVHLAMDRLVNAYLARLRQWRELNVLAQTDGNYGVGSGGFGFTDELPKPGFDPNHVRTQDQWGCATAQIFSSVSPAMHEEFALQYERRWLENFGLTYYGCCEPLHEKLDVLASIPNLRKISMSPWADLDIAVPKINGKYVLSLKPSPAVFATDEWNPTQAEANLVDALEKTKGHPTEIILKDISTVRNDPKRLWEWNDMAVEVAERYA